MRQVYLTSPPLSSPEVRSLSPSPPLIGPFFLASLSWLAPSRRSMADGPASERPLAPEWHRRHPVAMETVRLAPPSFSLPLSDWFIPLYGRQGLLIDQIMWSFDWRAPPDSVRVPTQKNQIQEWKLSHGRSLIWKSLRNTEYILKNKL